MNEIPRKGRPREFFRIKPSSNKVTVVGIRTPNRERGRSVAAFAHPNPVWYLESRAEVNVVIRELEEARDRAFPES